MNNYYLNKLVAAAHTSMSARWRLGELLHEAETAGKLIIVDKENRLITIRERGTYGKS